MNTPFQSFFLNLLSLVLLLILGGLSFLIFDRLVLEGKYTSPYNKDAVIRNLGIDLNNKVRGNNMLREQLNECGSTLQNTKNELSAIPMYQLNSTVSNAIGPDNQVMLEKGRLMFREQTYFRPSSADLSASAKNGLDKVVNVLSRLSQNTDFPWVLRIEGHADPQKEPSSSGFGSNWKMAYARAYNVVEYLISKGIDAKRLYIASFSSYRPGPYPNDRRVSLSFDYGF